VKVFLEQCLLSVREALKGMDAEVFVVDNASIDGSVEMLREKFEEVRLIANKENVGFSKANNQAIRISKGEYILLLNPDTLVEEDTFVKVVNFMDAHPEAGGLGVKMVDGKGNFLPESKRGLPTPSAAFYKIFGLSKLFPKSKFFSKYHLGYLPNNEINEIEVLSGAFMLMRKKALDEVGLLDEDYFMYGEDIDLSYRIIKGGYKNYYFPETRIIHYKGESTKKSSVNYVFVFYRAMVIFAKKHFSGKNAWFFSLLINLAIYLRASMAIANRILNRILHPLMDAFLLFGGLLLIKNYWEKTYIMTSGSYYPEELVTVAFPIYTLLWIVSIFFNGGYDRPIRLLKLFQGVFLGTFVILVAYALLPEHFRFSRAIIIFGTLWALMALSLERLLLHLSGMARFRIGENQNKRFAIAGSKKEAERVSSILKNTSIQAGFIGHVALTSDRKYEGVIGYIDQLRELIQIYNIDEVIFCSEDIAANTIIDKMSQLSDTEVEMKIAPAKTWAIIGSQSINTVEDIYMIDIDSINKISNRRNKRTLDLVFSFLLLLTFPVSMLFVKSKLNFLANLTKVIVGKKSWVGYSPEIKDKHAHLPRIREGIINPLDIFEETLEKETIYNLNILYAKDYSIANDIRLIIKAFNKLGG
jgi:GT2 family glycosyltransferase